MEKGPMKHRIPSTPSRAEAIRRLIDMALKD
jgi:hypothetical protein